MISYRANLFESLNRVVAKQYQPGDVFKESGIADSFSILMIERVGRERGGQTLYWLHRKGLPDQNIKLTQKQLDDKASFNYIRHLDLGDWKVGDFCKLNESFQGDQETYKIETIFLDNFDMVRVGLNKNWSYHNVAEKTVLLVHIKKPS
jgi:hypothetical protein